MRLLSFLLLVLFCSCNSSGFQKKIAGSDSLVINFYGSNTDSIVKTVTTIEKNAINRLSQFIDSKSTEQFKCGYDGNMIFYSKGEALLPIAFKYKEASCRHFLFELDGKLVSTTVNNEAADFLQSLEQGKNDY